MTGEAAEVAVVFYGIGNSVTDALRTVDYGIGAYDFGGGNHLLNGHGGAGEVGNMSDGHDSSPLIQHLVVSGQV